MLATVTTETNRGFYVRDCCVRYTLSNGWFVSYNIRERTIMVRFGPDWRRSVDMTEETRDVMFLPYSYGLITGDRHTVEMILNYLAN